MQMPSYCYQSCMQNDSRYKRTARLNMKCWSHRPVKQRGHVVKWQVYNLGLLQQSIVLIVMSHQIGKMLAMPCKTHVHTSPWCCCQKCDTSPIARCRIGMNAVAAKPACQIRATQSCTALQFAFRLRLHPDFRLSPLVAHRAGVIVMITLWKTAWLRTEGKSILSEEARA